MKIALSSTSRRSAQGAILAVLVSSAPAAHAQGLITKVNTGALMGKLGLRARGVPACRPTGVNYFIGPRASGFDESITIGVFASPRLAAERYTEALKTRPRTLEAGEPWEVRGIGDELRCSGSTTSPSSPGLILLRRRNVILETGWRGSYAGALRAARRLDSLLLGSPAVAPKGARVPVPAVSLERVPRVVQALKTFTVGYRSRSGPVLARADVIEERGWATAGSAFNSVTRPGRRRASFDFASRGNVLATRSVVLDVLPRAQG